MRVSNVVREYIEKSVRAVYEEKYGVTKLRHIAERSREEIENAEREVYEAARLAVAGVIETYKQMHPEFEYNQDAQFAITTRWHSVINKDKMNKAYNEYQVTKDKIDEKISEKVQEIIVTLELGGNKDDLDRMLAQLSEEE